MKKNLAFFLVTTTVVANLLYANENTELVKNHDMLEISKNFLKTYEVHGMFSDSQRTLGRLNNVNFSMKPLSAPIKPFDTLKVHYAYPLKIFLPKGTTITSAVLSNSTKQPNKSQNVVTVEVPLSFESGLLDIVYIQGFDTNTASYISIKLDKYLPIQESEVIDDKLYTQVEYYVPKKMEHSQIIASLKPESYGNEHSRLQYMGVTYDIYLVSVVKDTKVEKRYKDDKYINSAIMYNGYTYNYFIE